MPSTAATQPSSAMITYMETPMLERVKASIRFAATEYTSVMITPNTMVPRTPPMAPSTVFLGLTTGQSLCLPKARPAK